MGCAMRLDDLFISPEATLAEALRALDNTAKGILLVVEDGDRLTGTLTDGDVRRALLKEGELSATVGGACNRSFSALPLSRRAEAEGLMTARQFTGVPIVNGEGRVVDCAFRAGASLRRERHGELEVPVVVMAGGKGTRLYPYTKVLPKPLIPVNDVPIVERVINSFREQGCGEFYLIVNHQRQMVEAYFAGTEHHYSVNFIEEDEFLGTGGGLRLAKGVIDRTFVLTNCDILVSFDLREALEVHRATGNAVTMVASLKNYEIPYGTVELDAGGQIAVMTEKPVVPFLVNTGCYIVEPCVIDFIGKGESVGFPELIERCQASKMRAGAYPISEKSWLDMGQMDELANMARALQ